MNTSAGIDPATMLGPELTETEERALLEREVRANFNMSLAEFERRWRTGEFRDDEDPRITSVGMLLH
ncbi:MAG: hypothetical protein ACRDT2_16580 [Natronosporangium sp.]